MYNVDFDRFRKQQIYCSLHTLDGESPRATLPMFLLHTCIWQELLELLVDPEGQRQSSATVASAAPPSHVLCCPL